MDGDRVSVTPKVHELKTWPEYYAALWAGKTFEVRRNDRGFAVGDLLDLQEWDPDGVTVDPETQVETPGRYSGNGVLMRVTYVLGAGPLVPLPADYVVMGIEFATVEVPDDC